MITELNGLMVRRLFRPPLDPLSSGTGTRTDPSEPLPSLSPRMVQESTSDAPMLTADPLVLSPQSAGPGALLECGYRNASDRMVIVRCLGPQAFFLERVVFPFELLSFACPPESEVEILTHSLGGPELLEAMPASSLRLNGAAEVIDPPELSDTVSINPWLQAS
jgi:hypothetical protein